MMRSSTPDFANIKQSPDNVPDAAAYAKARRREVRPGSGRGDEDVDLCSLDLTDDRGSFFGSSIGVTSDGKSLAANSSVRLVKLDGWVAVGSSCVGEFGGELNMDAEEDDKDVSWFSCNKE